ncbi:MULTISPECIES: TrkH family potassium uptake protein [Clostridium]|uniref:H(+)-transporting ATPase n=1 Tax=Clostridium butyricum TaxID=1492 RepID=A0AAP9UD64_CLOBU|nr:MULTISPECIES: potassium transporter TrkG [Clostridium]AXB83912.1 H(+)-transporting ATPase [Clostridium butyricum]KIU06800.1 cation transport protein [Clostridium butyricum]MBA8966635.1 trk system potassium uptake protein TrkH [Clostridium butyricum]MBA8972301.1 trk system potassium uptake protein TrkH [Clostridium butyricum]MBC2425925.1 H(+)-transporting ATPase [Clostridium butyricum]
MNKLKHISPGRLIVLGFFMVIMIGAFLLMSPFSRRSGVDVSFVDALFTSTSAVCVTGLIAIDTADTFNLFGKTVVAMLIQIGGLGVTSIGVGLILLIGRNVGIKQRMLVKEALNLTSMKGIVKLIKAVIIMTISFEIVGAILSYIVFSKDYKPLDAVGISIFHSIAAFNNSGFDVLGNFQNLSSYRDNILLNLVTCGLIIFGGLGFLTIKEIIEKHSFEKFSLHTKIVITMTGSLLIVGTVLLKFTENISWLTAFFYSTSARTAGFSTAPLSGFTSAGLFTIVILMFIGASPGSTGGGIKTTTFFAIIKNVYSASTNKHCVAFKRELSKNTIAKASIIATLSLTLVVVDTFILSIIEPEFSFMQILFEVTSAFGTVGLSTGITPSLSDLSKLIITLTMFIGRLGPLTMATIWTFKPTSHVHYLEEDITIG